MNIHVGSTALNKFGIELPRNKGRERFDNDLFVSEGSSYHEQRGDDVFFIPLSHMEKIKTEDIDGELYATPESILTIKMSHMHWDIKWDKTLHDVSYLLSQGYTPNWTLYESMLSFWKELNGDKEFLSLNKNKDAFFDDHVDYKYDHDYLHELVAFPNKPMYTNCLKDGEQVLIDKEKFDRMSFRDRIRMFREEITVIAIERWLVHKKGISWWKAYKYALRKTVTTLTKNWATDFLVRNIQHFEIPNFELFDHALTILELRDYSFIGLDLVMFAEENDDILLNSYEEEDENINQKIKDMLVWKTLSLEEWEHQKDIGLEYLNADCLYDPDNMEKWFERLEENDWEIVKKNVSGFFNHIECVFKFKDKYYKVEYANRSRDGFLYDDILNTFREVKPVVKPVTFYEEV